MRVFVLNTGRCGSTTMIRACEHLTNYSAGHETRSIEIGEQRFAYPDQHVEADNRLSWFLGDLERRFGKDPLYVHLLRSPEEVALSFWNRWDPKRGGRIINAFANGILLTGRPWPLERRLEICRFYVDTVTANIESFLADKPHRMTVRLEEAASWFPRFWERIEGDGDQAAALAEFSIRHNSSE